MRIRNSIRSGLSKIEDIIGPNILLPLIQGLITRKVLAQILDGILDYLERKALESTTQIDDKIVRLLRNILDDVSEVD